MPTDESRPLISTMGGFPGEKKRSLILGALASIARKRAAVEIGAAAAVERVGATATAVGETGATELLLEVICSTIYLTCLIYGLILSAKNIGAR